jgi:hypothetical protein
VAMLPASSAAPSVTCSTPMVRRYSTDGGVIGR